MSMDSFFNDLERTRPNDKLTVPQGASVSTISKSPVNFEARSTPYGCFLSCAGRDARLEMLSKPRTTRNTSFGDLAEVNKSSGVPEKGFSFAVFAIADGRSQKDAVERQELDDSVSEVDSSSGDSDSDSTSEMLEFEAPAEEDAACVSDDSSIDEFCAAQAPDFHNNETWKEGSVNKFSCEQGQVGPLHQNQTKPKLGGVYVTDVLVEDINEALKGHKLASGCRSIEEQDMFHDKGVSLSAQSFCFRPKRIDPTKQLAQLTACQLCANSLFHLEKSGSTIATRLTASSICPRFSTLARSCKCRLRRTKSLKKLAAPTWPMNDPFVRMKVMVEGKKRLYGSLEF